MDTSTAALFGLICSFNHFSITCRADYMFSEFRKSSESEALARSDSGGLIG